MLVQLLLVFVLFSLLFKVLIIILLLMFISDLAWSQMIFLCFNRKLFLFWWISSHLTEVLVFNHYINRTVSQVCHLLVVMIYHLVVNLKYQLVLLFFQPPLESFLILLLLHLIFQHISHILLLQLFIPSLLYKFFLEIGCIFYGQGVVNVESLWTFWYTRCYKN